MKLKSLTTTLLLLLVVLLHAQTLSQDLIDKKLQKSKSIRSKSDEKDVKYLQSLIEDYPDVGDFWDELADVQVDLYNDALQKDQNYNLNFTITQNGVELHPGDSAYQSIQSLLNMMKPSHLAFDNLISTCKQSSLHTNTALWCSALLRIYLFDEHPDSSINPTATDYYNRAEKEFDIQNYSQAISFYKKAIGADSSFYKARVYLADAYYNNGDYPKAIEVFQDVIALYPNMLEPRKYLVDTYYKNKNYQQAFDAAADAVMIYPDYSLFDKMDYSADKLNKNFDSKWMVRGCSCINEDGTATGYTGNSPWRFYAEAADLIKSYCDSSGIIGPNSLTNEKYREVYAWKYMIEKSSDASFLPAREMYNLGYLDCYVLISNFQYDLLPQFQDLIKNNPEKVKDYFAMLMK